MPAPKVEFHFDFGSPNAYLSHLVIPEIERRQAVGGLSRAGRPRTVCEHSRCRPAGPTRTPHGHRAGTSQPYRHVRAQPGHPDARQDTASAACRSVMSRSRRVSTRVSARSTIDSSSRPSRMRAMSGYAKAFTLQSNRVDDGFHDHFVVNGFCRP